MTNKSPQFPSHAHPRVWLITSITSPIGIAIARQALQHGDYIIAGVPDTDMLVNGGYDHNAEEGERREEFREFWAEAMGKREWKERCKGVSLDARCEEPFMLAAGWELLVGQCQAAVADAMECWGRLDILFCCHSEALIGTVEEFSASTRTQTLVREQFESNFFGPVNVIKAALPAMRKRNSGHIVILTVGHLGTPGLGMYCASGWALEGFCDSLAYEIAPFNIKVTIVQPTMEIGVLTNKIISAPLLPQYAPQNNPAPLFRGIIDGLLGRIQDSQHHDRRANPTLATDEITSLYPKLPTEMKAALLAETVNAITAIGGHENPPARHIVGHEGVASVKEKLKTVSEELEDFVEVSCAVDIDEEGEGIEGANGSALE